MQNMGKAWRVVMICVAVLCILSVYFAPTGVAILKQQKNQDSIFVVNLLLGWTLIGWVVALAWAFANNSTAEPVDKKSV